MISVKGSRCRKKAAAAFAAGFTVIELLTSIVIIGVIAAASAPRMFDNRAFSERGYIDEVASTLRYAQKIAIATQCDVQVTVNAGGYVAMQRAAAAGINTCNPIGVWTTAIRRTDGSQLSGSAPVGVVLAPATTVTFGVDGNVIGAAPPQLSIGATFAITVSANGAVTVTP
jgi:MSHA pilin protein MshC